MIKDNMRKEIFIMVGINSGTKETALNSVRRMEYGILKYLIENSKAMNDLELQDKGPGELSTMGKQLQYGSSTVNRRAKTEVMECKIMCETRSLNVTGDMDAEAVDAVVESVKVSLREPEKEDLVKNVISRLEELRDAKVVTIPTNIWNQKIIGIDENYCCKTTAVKMVVVEDNERDVQTVKTELYTKEGVRVNYADMGKKFYLSGFYKEESKAKKSDLDFIEVTQNGMLRPVEMNVGTEKGTAKIIVDNAGVLLVLEDGTPVELFTFAINNRMTEKQSYDILGLIYGALVVRNKEKITKKLLKIMAYVHMMGTYGMLGSNEIGV